MKKILISILALFAIATTASAQNKINGHEYVDLGLPSGLLWATCNVGADKPEDYGDHFAWGETEPKENYSWDTYEWGKENALTKYTKSDGKTKLDSDDDAATANWGGKWRMPTYDEFKELVDNTTKKWTKLNGVNGYEFTATNGKSIFLPAAGEYNGGSLQSMGVYGCYWLSSLSENDPAFAYNPFFQSVSVGWYDNLVRYRGCSVRPVVKKSEIPPTGIAIDATNFPDANFRNVVADKKIDKDGNSYLSDAEIAAVTEIDVKNQSISSLKGIEHFTAVKELFCQTTGLTELDVTKNTELTRLACGQNQIAKLDLSKNTKLENLHCGHNKVLAELDVSMLPNLWRLYCRENQLKTLDVSKNTELTVLDCGYNLLEKLDVSKNTKLQNLLCFDNSLTALNVSGCTALISLSCSENQLPSLDVSGCTALTSLNCSGNQLTSLDVSGCTALISLSCHRNSLKRLDLSKNTELLGLGCCHNQLTELDLSNNKKLLELYIYGNQIKGDKMLALVNSLPTVSEEYLVEEYSSEAPFYAIDTEDENEQNVITKSQVKIATDKNWKVYSYHYDESTDEEHLQEYEGSDDIPTSIEVHNRETITNNDYYTIDGKKLNGEPTQKGVYIVNGKKVVK